MWLGAEVEDEVEDGAEAGESFWNSQSARRQERRGVIFLRRRGRRVRDSGRGEVFARMSSV